MNAMTKTTTDAPDTMIETPQTVTPKPKVQRSTGVVLIAANGSEQLRVVAMRKKDGSGTTHVVHTTKNAAGRLTHTRGATEKHADFAAAKTRIDVIVRDATKKGWALRPSRGGFKARPDAFDVNHIPTPAGAKTSKK